MEYTTLTSQVHKLVEHTKELTIKNQVYEDEIDKLVGEMTTMRIRRNLPSNWAERLRPRKKRKTETGYVATNVNGIYLPEYERNQNRGQH